MDTNIFYEQLNSFFAKHDLQGAKKYLEEQYEKGLEAEDDVYVLIVLNEIMGFCRDTGAYDESIEACHKALDVMKRMGIEGTVEYATSLQNMANAHRAAGLHNEALELFKKTEKIYEGELEPTDKRIASLHNNIALLYQEMGDYTQAVEQSSQALHIIEQLDSPIEVAITLANLAASEIELGRLDDASGHLECSLEIFRQDEEKNFHYSAALCAMAALQVKKDNAPEALALYEEALVEIEKHMGKESHAYKVCLQNFNSVKSGKNAKNAEETKTAAAHDAAAQNSTSEKQLSGLELSRKFYEEYGKDMIHKNFPEYEDRIAVGLCGEGSEVFGFDDEISRDHDFGPGFCMWVDDEVYEKIGKKLNELYDLLPTEFMGTKRLSTVMAEGRLGVWRIDDFFEHYTGYKSAPTSEGAWIEIEDQKLATVTNGEIYRDDAGEFTKRRQGFMSQPPAAYRVKLARTISMMAQTGQCNYARSMARQDYVTANMCIAKFMEATLQCIFALNDAYAPYYKWMLKGSKDLEILPEVGDIMRALADTADQRDAWEHFTYTNNVVNQNDTKAMIVEMTAKLIINELRNQGLIKEIKTNFLGDYVHEIYASEKSPIMEALDRNAIIKKIVKLEFEAFDKVQNIDGRANCQDDWPYFNVMRTSQYMTWPDDMLSELLKLWEHNKATGWNMITEKYARMMESTDPERYKELEKNLPLKSIHDIKVVDQIAQIQVDWMEEFAEQYPLLASQARTISSNSDEVYNTSYETYLKGELLTYSSELIKMYGKFIVKLAKEGKNLAQMTIANTAKLQGYSTLEAAEASLAQNN